MMQGKMTANEALKLIKHATTLQLDFNGQGQIVSNETLEGLRQIIISALEKQIPKKPLEIEREYSGECGFCPNCKKVVDDRKEFKMCHDCGQLLDWRQIE